MPFVIDPACPVPCISKLSSSMSSTRGFTASARAMPTRLRSPPERCAELISPVAWRHVHLNGRYGFRDGGQAIDFDAVIQGLDLG